MNLHRLQEKALLTLACCGLALAQSSACADEAVKLASTPAPASAAQDAQQAASFDSTYAAEQHLRSAGSNTPEADARPGTYYFMEAAYALSKHDHRFAIQMYQVSASWAYKPAEYNIGVMYARGEGVPVDLPRAMAWMALAAERGEPRYVDAREAVYASLSKEQFEQANVIWRELKKTYGDEVALRRAKARWAEVRASMTGSRVGSTGNLQVGMRETDLRDASAPRLVDALRRYQGNRSAGSTSAEMLGGNGVPGAIAYRQLLQSNDPYDPKFNISIGTTTVGKPMPVKAGKGGSFEQAADSDGKPGADRTGSDKIDADRRDSGRRDAQQRDQGERYL